jgi:hypothetical protein
MVCTHSRGTFYSALNCHVCRLGDRGQLPQLYSCRRITQCALLFDDVVVAWPKSESVLTHLFGKDKITDCACSSNSSCNTVPALCVPFPPPTLHFEEMRHM